MVDFDYEAFKRDYKAGNVKILNYPDGIDEFDRVIIDIFMEMNVNEKNMSITTFENRCVKKYIEQTTNKNFLDRIKGLREKGVEIKPFPKKTKAICVGYNPENKGKKNIPSE